MNEIEHMDYDTLKSAYKTTIDRAEQAERDNARLKLENDVLRRKVCSYSTTYTPVAVATAYRPTGVKDGHS